MEKCRENARRFDIVNVDDEIIGRDENPTSMYLSREGRSSKSGAVGFSLFNTESERNANKYCFGARRYVKYT